MTLDELFGVVDPDLSIRLISMGAFGWMDKGRFYKEDEDDDVEWIPFDVPLDAKVVRIDTGIDGTLDVWTES
jgi:hypothetical protein